MEKRGEFIDFEIKNLRNIQGSYREMSFVQEFCSSFFFALSLHSIPRKISRRG